MINQLKETFKGVFPGHQTPRLFFAPGRVNLIGEHTDYNGGYVLPCALKRGSYALVAPRNDNQLNLYSMNFETSGTMTFDVGDLPHQKNDHWTDYPLGVIDILAKKGMTLSHGFDVLFYGNIPNGAGLSSSASMELVTVFALDALHQWQIDPVEKVLISQMAENQFVGVQCGIMDQFIIGMGKANHALLLNTQDLSYTYAPLNLGQYALVITNTNKKRGLADSKYNERRFQCEMALKALNRSHQFQNLCDLSKETFDKYQDEITDPIILKRAKHVVYENARTQEAIQALNQNDLLKFGQLMNASHLSLKEDYEVTGLELDTLVMLQQAYEGVIGSRMTGAGFGGCTVTLIKSDKVESFIEDIGRSYQEKIGVVPDFYPVEVGPGVHEMAL